MIEILLGALIPLFIAVGMIVIAVRRGLEFRDLSEHGVDATAKVIKKSATSPSSRKSRRPKIVYQYNAPAGGVYSRASFVSWEAYNQHEVGSDISIVYSAKNPSVSAPKYLVDQARAALQK